MTRRARRMGEVVEILSGFPFQSQKFAEEGDIRVVRIRDIQRGESKTYYTGDYDPKFVLRTGDILIGMDGEFNRARWRGGAALLNQRVCRVQSCSETLSDGYLFHLLPRALKSIENTTPFVTVKHLSIKTLQDLELVLPSRDEQERIAAVLDRSEALRAKRRATLAQLDTLTESMFLDLFGDPVTNPMGWPNSLSLGDAAHIASGVTKGRKLKSESARTVPYLAVANVQDRALSLDGVKYIEASEDEIERFRLIKNDLLLTEGGDPDKLGRGTLWQNELPECIHQNHIFRVRLTTDTIEPLYLNWLIGSQRGKRYFLRSAKQTTGIASINMTQLRAFPLLTPPRALQQQFARCIAAVEKLKSAQRASLAELDALFASLQHLAFLGEL